MEERINKLIAVFTDNGWRSLGSADISSDWWFRDIIHLSSIWRPVGTSIYLTLLTDPQELKSKIVWAVAISLELPTDRHFKFLHQITLNDIKNTDLKRLVNTINNDILK